LVHQTQIPAEPDAVTGPFNVVYGGSKVARGVPLMLGGTAADVTGVGAVVGVPAQALGLYHVVTGGARTIRGGGQMSDAIHQPMVSQSPVEFLVSLPKGVLPDLGSKIDFVGGLF
jgi:hypothetical protein